MVVWQQPPDISVETPKLVEIHNDTTIEITQTNHTTESHEWVDVESQTSSVKATSPEKSRSNMEPLQENGGRS